MQESVAVAGLVAAMLALLPGAAVADSERIVRRADDPAGWPFSVEEGTLQCLRLQQKAHVFFSEPWPEYDLSTMSVPYVPRSVAVTTDPLALVLVNLQDRSLLAPSASLEELIRRMAPYETAGRLLCDPS